MNLVCMHGNGCECELEDVAFQASRDVARLEVRVTKLEAALEIVIRCLPPETEAKIGRALKEAGKPDGP